MEDLSVYRTTDFTGLVELRQNDRQRFDKFTNRVYRIFENLQPGKSFDLSYIEVESRPIFIQIACMAICEGNNLEFSTDFTSIRKSEPIPTMNFKVNKDDKEGE